MPAYPAPELDPSAFLDETLNRLVEWLSALAQGTPRLLVVEDLHWADPSTLGLLGRLVGRYPAGLLTVATTRDPSVIPWTDAVGVLRLGRLDEASATALIDNLAAGAELTHDRRESVVAQAEGIPLFIEELTRSFLDDTRSDTLPLRIQELFTSRLKVPGVDLRVVQVAATVGPTFDAATVSAVIGDDDAVAEQLRLLSDEGIVEPAGPATGTYRFRHALMRDAAYETQVLEVRRATHAAVADTIAAAGAEPALIAQHLDLAGAADRAAHLYGAAAQAEQARGAHLEATRLLSRVLELLEGLPESEQRDLGELTARMLRALSVSSMRGYAAPEVQSDHRRAEVLATRLGRAEVLPSLIAIWGVLADQRRPDHGPRPDRPAPRHGRPGRVQLVRAGGAVLRRLPRVLQGTAARRAGAPGGRHGRLRRPPRRADRLPVLAAAERPRRRLVDRARLRQRRARRA